MKKEEKKKGKKWSDLMRNILPGGYMPGEEKMGKPAPVKVPSKEDKPAPKAARQTILPGGYMPGEEKKEEKKAVPAAKKKPQPKPQRRPETLLDDRDVLAEIEAIENEAEMEDMMDEDETEEEKRRKYHEKVRGGGYDKSWKINE